MSKGGKVIVLRESERAVDPIEYKEYEAEFKSEFDRIMDEFGADQMVVHKKLIELDNKLQEKYDVIVEINIPSSRKAWREFLEKYGTCEIGIHPDANKVYIKIMDHGVF